MEWIIDIAKLLKKYFLKSFKYLLIYFPTMSNSRLTIFLIDLFGNTFEPHALHEPPPSTQKRAQCGWLRATGARASFSVRPMTKRSSSGNSVHGMTIAWSSLLRFTTMREEAHIIASGRLFSMPQHASLISGTSSRSSISGNSTSADLSSASRPSPSVANSRA